MSASKPGTNVDARDYLRTPEDWTRFVSALVHELRTPLASLRMLADLLAAARLGEQEKRYAESVRQVALDLQAVVGEVSELAQLLAGRTQARNEEVVLEQLLEQVREAVRPPAWERGIALTESLDPAVPRQVRTDPDRLRRALTLLLGAAVSQARSEVSFRLDLGEGDLRFVVSSDGDPFPQTEPQTLFEPFPAGAGIGRRFGGRSLALPLANELALALGGALRARNHGGRPTFDLLLPAGS